MTGGIAWEARASSRLVVPMVGDRCRLVLIAGVVAAVTVSVTGSSKASPTKKQAAASKARVATDQALALRAAQVQLAAGRDGGAAERNHGRRPGRRRHRVDHGRHPGLGTSRRRGRDAAHGRPGRFPAGVAIHRCSPAGRHATGSWRRSRTDGVTAQRAATFATVVPTALVTASVWPSDGLSVGVGQPIVFTFNHYVDTSAARASGAVAHLGQHVQAGPGRLVLVQ